MMLAICSGSPTKNAAHRSHQTPHHDQPLSLFFYSHGSAEGTKAPRVVMAATATTARQQRDNGWTTVGQQRDNSDHEGERGSVLSPRTCHDIQAVGQGEVPPTLAQVRERVEDLRGEHDRAALDAVPTLPLALLPSAYGHHPPRRAPLHTEVMVSHPYNGDGGGQKESRFSYEQNRMSALGLVLVM